MKLRVTQDYVRQYDDLIAFERGEAIMRERAGWVWCVNRAGKQGWLPLENIEQA